MESLMQLGCRTAAAEVLVLEQMLVHSFAKASLELESQALGPPDTLYACAGNRPM